MNYVLIVDDSSMDRRLAGLLEHVGPFQVEYASDGADGWNILKIGSPSPW